MSGLGQKQTLANLSEDVRYGANSGSVRTLQVFSLLILEVRRPVYGVSEKSSLIRKMYSDPYTANTRIRVWLPVPNRLIPLRNGQPILSSRTVT